MNPVLTAIKNRRSVRQYRPEQITKEELDAILEAGMWAPSSHNSQPWHFTVIQDPAKIKQLSDETKKILATSEIDWVRKIGLSDRNIFHGAPTVVIVSGHQGDSFEPIVDCAAAIQNMLLAAESLDIGSCWNGLVRFYFNTEAGRKFVPLPEGYIPYYAVSLGYKKVPNGPGPQRKGIQINYL